MRYLSVLKIRKNPFWQPLFSRATRRETSALRAKEGQPSHYLEPYCCAIAAASALHEPCTAAAILA